MFTHPSVNGHLDHFHLLAAVNSAATNVSVQRFPTFSFEIYTVRRLHGLNQDLAGVDQIQGQVSKLETKVAPEVGT